MAGDVAQQQRVVTDRRATLALRRRFRPRSRTAMIRLEAELGAAERHLALLQQRQAAWRRDRTFERDLVERVLLMARIADFCEASGRALRNTREGIGAAVSRTVWPADADEGPAGDNAEVTTLAAVLGYLRTHHPPTC